MAEKFKKRLQKSSIHLIASNINNQFQYNGFCKIEINHVQSILFVEPLNEEFKLISAMFKWKFYAQKNILFVFAENGFQDFILVFNNEIKCKRVYDLIYRKKAKDEIRNKQIYQRILLPIFTQVIKVSNIHISKFLLKWINKLEKNDKQFYVKMMKENGIYDMIYPKNNIVGERNFNSNDASKVISLRKRKLCETNLNDSSKNESTYVDEVKGVRKNTFNKFIKCDSEFKMVNINGKRKLLKRLLIFDSADKKFCYEYSQHPLKQNIFHCIGCKDNRISVRAKINKSGDLFVQNQEHSCKTLLYSDEKYFELQILKKPNYEILENTNTASGRILIMFNPNERNECHEFRWKNRIKLFICLGCSATARHYNNSIKDDEYIELRCLKHESKCYIYRFRPTVKYFRCLNCIKQRIAVSAKLQQNSDGEDYIVLSNKQHVCEPEKYIPENCEPKIADKYFFYRNKKYPNSVFVAIFYPTDSTLCYSFLYLKDSNKFRCSNCFKLKKYFFISPPKKDENGKEYFIHDLKKHFCKPTKVSTFQTSEFQKLKRNKIIFQQIPKKKKEVKIDESKIVKMPNFEIRPSQKSLQEGKLVIFDENDKDLCYEYYYIKAMKMFVCKTCIDKKHYVTAKAHVDDENGEKFIELSKNEHICDPIKDEFKEKTIKSSNFIVLDRNDETKNTRIHLFTSTTKEFCYELTYVPSKNLYRCYQCKKLHATVCVKLNKNKNGEEYLLKLKNEHVCIPKKYDQIQPPKTVPKPMFELYRNYRGVPNKKLIVFTSESKDFIYEYTWNKKLYCCLGCNNQNKIVTAKLCGEENEKYVELSKAEHICKPQKYDEKKFKK